MQNKIIASVRRWLETIVIGLNLCPFAKREYLNNRVRFVVCEASSEAQLIEALQAELELLHSDESIETTLLIHPEVLNDFYDYNDFLSIADELLVLMQLEGVFQIASFHPDYQFSGTARDDVENYSNRSPYPILHILRERSLEKAIASHPDTSRIPDDNIAAMNKAGLQAMQTLLARCSAPDKR